MSNTSMKKVFLSSTAGDLIEYRAKVHKAIESLEGYHCVRMEDFTSQSDEPEQYLRERVKECDIMVSLVGLCYGSSPPGSDYSFTELEYMTAKEAGLPCLAFLLPEDFQIAANILREDKNWDKQKKFREQIEQDVIREAFKTPDELATQVVAAIRNWENRSWKGNRGAPEPVDCVILCGGYASRLWPLTIDISKVTLPVGGRPVLSHVIEFASKSPFVRRILLSVNVKYKDQLTPFERTPDSSATHIPVNMIVEPESGPHGKLGPLGALGYVISKIGCQDLLVLGGDNLFGFELEEFQRFGAGWKRSVNAVFRSPYEEEVSEYGVARLAKDNLFVDFQEKCPIPSFKDVSTACYLFRHDDLKRLHTYLEQGQDPDSLGNFLHWLTKGGNSPLGYRFSSTWFDIGTRDKLIAANKQFMQNYRRGTSIKSNIKDPVMLHEMSAVENSNIGPYVWLSKGTRVVDSEVKNSIILDDVVVRKACVHNSIIGPGSVIEGDVGGLVCGPNNKISHRH